MNHNTFERRAKRLYTTLASLTLVMLVFVLPAFADSGQQPERLYLLLN